MRDSSYEKMFERVALSWRPRELCGGLGGSSGRGGPAAVTADCGKLATVPPYQWGTHVKVLLGSGRGIVLVFLPWL